jgi:hypothetical protein
VTFANAAVQFSQSYDFDGWELLREEAQGSGCTYAVWPSNGRWSLFRDIDGMLAFEGFDTIGAAKVAAVTWEWDRLQESLAPSARVLTVVIRDTYPARYLNEPCTHRTVRINLTREQVEALAFLPKDTEEISFCFIEPEVRP